MNISKKMQDAIGGQVTHELYSAYLYLSMSHYCVAQNLPGFAHWLRLQWEEEIGHALRLMDYVARREGSVALDSIKKPPSEFGPMVELFEQVLKHEQSVTTKIHDLYDLAMTEKDYASSTELQWFITEQVEEEDNASQILETLRQIGDNLPELLVLDRSLGERTTEPGA